MAVPAPLLRSARTPVYNFRSRSLGRCPSNRTHRVLRNPRTSLPGPQPGLRCSCAADSTGGGQVISTLDLASPRVPHYGFFNVVAPPTLFWDGRIQHQPGHPLPGAPGDPLTEVIRRFSGPLPASCERVSGSHPLRTLGLLTSCQGRDLKSVNSWGDEARDAGELAKLFCASGLSPPSTQNLDPQLKVLSLTTLRSTQTRGSTPSGPPPNLALV